MNKTKAALTVLAGGFVLFILGALREVVDPVAAARDSGVIARAEAATPCAAPSVDALQRSWKIVSTGCTDCAQGHLQVGDLLTFAKDVSGATNFSLAVKPGKADRAASRTEGYTLRSDGVGNVTGPIVFEHSVLDGSPLQLHWLIVKVRNFDANGLGQCKLAGRVNVCNEEPAPGASSCSSLQHAGSIHLEPSID
jgi:hypothetical protein